MRGKHSKKLLALIMAAAMVFALLPTAAFAAEGGAESDSVTVRVSIKNYAFKGALTADDGTEVEPAWEDTFSYLYRLTVEKGETLGQAILDEGFFKAEGTPSYITAINGLSGGIGISSETQWGRYDMSGWLLYLNGAKPVQNGTEVGADALGNQARYTDYSGNELDCLQLENNDRINLYYSIDGKTLVDENILPKATIKTETKKKAIKISTKEYEDPEITGYEYAYRLSGSKTWKTTMAKSPAKTIKSLKSGKKYKVKVRVILNTHVKAGDSAADLTRYYGDWSRIRTVKTK